MKRKKVILITGCAGFIGSNFTKRFKERFPKVGIVGIDDFSTGRKDALDKKIKFYKGSVCDQKFVSRVFKKHKPEYVFHFAALPRVSYSVEEPVKTSEINIMGTITLLNEARKNKTKRFIYSSSSAVYGGEVKMPTKETECPLNPVSPYAAQKYAGEPFCKIFSNLYGLDTVSLRYFNVFGPGQYGDSPYSTVVSAWMEALYFPGRDNNPFLEGDGKQSRDFCFVDNVVDANIKAMLCARPLKGGEFNIAHGERTDLLKVKNLIEKYTGKKLNLEKRPPRAGDIRHTHADISKARRLLGYRPKINFEDGLKRTITWFEDRRR